MTKAEKRRYNKLFMRRKRAKMDAASYLEQMRLDWRVRRLRCGWNNLLKAVRA